MFGEVIGLHILESATFHFFRHGYLKLRFARCAMVRRSDDIRIAFSALLLLRDGDGYLLVRNLHRPETFGPFGGVIKYRNNSVLDKLEFKPQTVGPGDDMKNDLRGFLPRKNLAALVVWFKHKKERESASECLTRELKEEILEAHLPQNIKCPEVIDFRFVRRVEEGPEHVPGQTYTQYRIFEVYEADTSKPSVKKFTEQLVTRARRGQPNLLLASAQEIRSGRAASDEIIGHHAGYLFGKTRVRPESPLFNLNRAAG